MHGSLRVESKCKIYFFYLMEKRYIAGMEKKIATGGKTLVFTEKARTDYQYGL
jgi:hypothetical protein